MKWFKKKKSSRPSVENSEHDFAKLVKQASLDPKHFSKVQHAFSSLRKDKRSQSKHQ